MNGTTSQNVPVNGPLSSSSDGIARSAELDLAAAGLLRTLPVDLSDCLYGVPAQSFASESYFDDGSAPAGIPNLGNTCFVSAVAQLILRIEPLAKVLDVHRQGCRVRSCGVCSAAAQCRIPRHRRKHESSPLAAAARNGVFGEVFKRGQ